MARARARALLAREAAAGNGTAHLQALEDPALSPASSPVRRSLADANYQYTLGVYSAAGSLTKSFAFDLSVADAYLSVFIKEGESVDLKWQATSGASNMIGFSEQSDSCLMPGGEGPTPRYLKKWFSSVPTGATLGDTPALFMTLMVPDNNMAGKPGGYNA